ncbi:uncharacterized protein PgNI_01817 [Pyricularia grisea]|uniref:Uncharacterized protein n=1 Tax=Pyricularia grisea TaxID=148305 RepID=A0A6P8BJD3_PYRGI|nr:uncharacterized protein PgNI_01817 [Pyricularia grisea]TLD16687.1 hypothetical protein PgNI_01817 [Pyricularia grisea]
MPRRMRFSETAQTIRQKWCMALSFSFTKQTRDGRQDSLRGKTSCHMWLDLFVRHLRFRCPWPGCMWIPECNSSNSSSLFSQSVVRAEVEARAARAETTFWVALKVLVAEQKCAATIFIPE